MGLKEIAKENLDFYAPRFQVKIENQKLAIDVSRAIIDLTVVDKVDEGASFTITLHDEFDMDTQKFKWLDHKLFDVGNTVVIDFGYGDKLKTMIEGNITSLEPSFFSGETPTLSVKGQDLSYNYIKKKSPARTFVNMAYSDIAKTIAKEAELKPEVDDTKKLNRPIRKDNNESYFTFLEKKAKEVDFQFKIDGRTIYFKKPEDTKEEIMTLELGKDIISFSPNLSTAHLYSEVEVRGHNPNDPTKPIIGRAKPGSERQQEGTKQTGSQVVTERLGKSKKVISNIIVYSEDHANAIAEAMLNKASDSFIEGDGESIGIPQIRPGVCIKLEKMGERFSGKYYVTSATHTINNSGYKTRFTVKRNAL
jgi:phage protein D